MRRRTKYNTKQREILLDYFETVPGTHVTAGDVYEYLRSKGTSIAQSTVYRQLQSLVDEGVIRKYIIDRDTPACFEYVRPENNEETQPFFHCKCEKCGKLIHLSCKELTEMESFLRTEHHFKLNAVRTVFYGLCERCM